MHDGQDTSRIFYPGSFSSLIDSIGEKHGETGFNPLGGFRSLPPPRRPRFRQPTAVTRRQNQPPSEQKCQPLFAVSLSPVPFPRLPLVAVIPSRVSTPFVLFALTSFSPLRCFPSRADPHGLSVFFLFAQLNACYASGAIHFIPSSPPPSSRFRFSIFIMKFLSRYHFFVSSHLSMYCAGYIACTL